jgi:hypothetical protein
MRCPNPDHICGFCTEFTVKDAEPEYAELGMGRCHGFDQDLASPVRYVAWDHKCVLFVRDVRNKAARGSFVEEQRAKSDSVV